MQINKVNSANLSFNGIKLTEYNDKTTRRIVKYLKLNGYKCAGKKTYYVSNEFKDKQNQAKFIRNHYEFDPDEFGVMFLPWSREAYILSEPSYEQKLLEWVNEMDSEAFINLGI